MSPIHFSFGASAEKSCWSMLGAIGELWFKFVVALNLFAAVAGDPAVAGWQQSFCGSVGRLPPPCRELTEMHHIGPCAYRRLTSMPGQFALDVASAATGWPASGANHRSHCAKRRTLGSYC